MYASAVTSEYGFSFLKQMLTVETQRGEMMIFFKCIPNRNCHEYFSENQEIFLENIKGMEKSEIKVCGSALFYGFDFFLKLLFFSSREK